LIDDNLQDGVEKVPGLGDIPLIGGLFRYKKRTHVKTNLMVFLRPTIIRNSEESASLAGDRYDYIRNQENRGQPDKATMLPNTESPEMPAPRLPPLKDGKMVGGPLANQPESGNPANTPPPSPPQSADPQQPAAPVPQQ
jgi:general secretion pathway protein D